MASNVLSETRNILKPKRVNDVGEVVVKGLLKKGPNTMARRNARERNRVKQVNQGFVTLKQHIPETYRMKKMSKVDTLRCALDYIRSLETVLDISYSDDPPLGHNLFQSSSFEDDESFGYNSVSEMESLQNICDEGEHFPPQNVLKKGEGLKGEEQRFITISKPLLRFPLKMDMDQENRQQIQIIDMGPI